jgi:PAS domain S-box-containing protein
VSHGTALPPIDHRRILDAMPEAVVAADAENRIVFANVGAHMLFGSQTELEGRPLVDLMPVRLRERHTSAFSRYFTTWSPHLLGRTLDIPILCGDGREVRTHMTLSPAASEDGDLLVVAVLRPVRAALDVSETEPTRH